MDKKTPFASVEGSPVLMLMMILHVSESIGTPGGAVKQKRDVGPAAWENVPASPPHRTSRIKGIWVVSQFKIKIIYVTWGTKICKVNLCQIMCVSYGGYSYGRWPL